MDRVPLPPPNRRHRVQKYSPYHKKSASSRRRTTFAYSPTNKPDVAHDSIASIKDVTLVDYDLDNNNLSDPEKEDSDFYWEEEDTLFSELMNDGPRQTKEAEIDQLIDSLQGAFSEQGTETKKKIADTMVGTRKHIKHTFSLIEQNVDPYYGKGIHLFNKASTSIEATCYSREAQIKEAYEATQKKIAQIFVELEAEFALRDQLWTNLETSINEIVEPLLESINDTPAEIERIIAKLEKELEKDTTKTETKNSTHKLLQELLKNR